MSSPPLAEPEYISLASPRPDDHFRPKTDVLVRPSREALHKPPSSRLKFTFLVRTGIFVVLELGFMILASLASANPIPINLSHHVTLTEAKSAFTIISIIWHTLAIFIVKDIILHIFSAEWMEQYRKSGSIILGETDSVSRITAGLLNQIQHFASLKATFPFRLGFVSVLLLMLLNGLGPSAITINSISVDQGQKIKVANLTMTKNLSDNGSDLLAVDRADLITQLEQLENAIYGFRASQANVLIPWPSSDLISTNGTIKYQSDVVNYNFTCSWKPPVNNQSILDWVVDNKGWNVFTSSESAASFQISDFTDALILPMEEDRVFLGNADSPLIAFLFIGSNTTLSQHVALNLEDIPTNFIPPIANSTLNNTLNEPCLVTTLVCNPQLRISPATVILSGGSLSADMHSGPPVVNNIPVEAVNAIFSQSLLEATSTRSSYTDQSIVNSIARILFLTDPSFSHDDKPEGIKPLSLDNINQKMNTVLLSSAKAFLSGYKPNDDNLTFPSFTLIETDATVETQQLALVGSRPFLIALIVVVGVLVVLLITLVTVVRVDRLQTFDLENIIKALRID